MGEQDASCSDPLRHRRHEASSRRQDVALLACAALTSCQATRPNATETRLPIIIAHRAGKADAPENTLEAVRLASTMPRTIALPLASV